MITVRFPNGQAVQYNSANYVERFTYGYSDLYEKKDGRWVAQVPNTCLIEIISACRVYNPLTDTMNEKITAELKAVKAELRAIKRKVGRG
jgi:hypothetical protein